VKPLSLCGGVRAVPRLCIILYPDICITTEQKLRKNLSQGIRKVLGLSVPSTIRLVDGPSSSDGLDWPAGPLRSWLSLRAAGSALGQLKYLRVAELGGSPRQLTLSRSSQLGLRCGRRIVEHRDPRESAGY
jgi:hypothetical protein